MTDPLPAKKFKILFLCTGNSARSILAEYFLRRLDPVHFETFSAGADPRGRPLRSNFSRTATTSTRAGRGASHGTSTATSRSTS